MSHTAVYMLTGTVLNDTTFDGEAGLRVEAWDASGVFPDLVCIATTDDDGNFRLRLSEDELRAIFQEREAEVFFRVIKLGTGAQTLADTADKQTWKIAAATRPVRIVVPATGPSAPALHDLKVSGRIYSAASGPLNGRIVNAYDVAIDTAAWKLLGTDTTDGRGRYRLAYPYAGSGGIISGKQLPDLRVEVLDAGGTNVETSVLRCQAAPSSFVDLVTEGSAWVRDRFTTVGQDTAAALGAANPGDLTEDQIQQLACFSGLSVGEVRAFADANRVSTQTGGSSPVVSHETVYALLHGGCSATGREQLLATPRGDLKGALESAYAERIVPPGNVADELDAVKTAAANLAKDAAAGMTFDQMLALYVPDVNMRNAFLGVYMGHEGTIPELWGSAAEIQSFPVADVQRTFQWGVLCRYFGPLMNELKGQHDGGTDCALAKLAARDETWWTARVSVSGAPADMPGEGLDEKKASYVQLIVRTLESVLPTAAFAGRVKRDALDSDLDKFFTQNPESYAFEKTRVDALPASAFTGLGNVEALKRDVRAYERLFRLTPRYAEMKALFDAPSGGLKSARAIVRYGRSAFVADFATALGGEAVAMSIHTQATAQAHAAAMLHLMLNPTVNGPAVSVVPSLDGAVGQPQGLFMSDWAKLFGTAGRCACKACSSVLSPAAYFVDLLNWLGQHSSDVPIGEGQAATWSMRDLLIGGTSGTYTTPGLRPDLAKVMLDCRSTNTPVPYIDLVNELLERRIAGLEAPDHLATTGAAEDLRVTPEAPDEDSHAAAYGALAGARYPFSLPFSLGHEQARSFLSHLGVPRHDLMEMLEAGADPELAALPPSCRLWLRADSGVTLVDAKLSEWVDRSDSSGATKAEQPGAGLRPGVGTGGVCNRPCVDFTGSERLYVLDSPRLDLSGATIVAVVSDFSAATNACLLVKGASGVAFDFGVSRDASRNVVAIHHSGDNTGPGWSATPRKPSIVVVEQTGAGTKFRIDGVVTLGAPNALQTNDEPLHIGALATNAWTGNPPSTFDRYFTGKVYEIFVFEGPLTTDETAAVEDYLSARYDVPHALAVAMERLGMTDAERELVVGFPDDEGLLWGLGAIDPSDMHAALSNLGTLGRASGLDFASVRELFETGYTARYFTSAGPTFVLADPEGDACDPDNIVVTGFDIGSGLTETALWGGIRRFLRLCQRLGLPVREVDKLVTPFGATLDDGLIEALGNLVWLRRRLPKVGAAELAAWWALIDTRATTSRQEPSLYERVFLNPAVTNPVPATFELPLSGSEAIDGHLPHVLASVRMAASDYALLTGESETRLRLTPALPSGWLTLENLSRIYRIASFARMAHLSVEDLLVLQALTGLAPLAGDVPAGPTQSRTFLEELDRLRGSGLSVARADYLTRHVTRPREGSGGDEAGIDATLAQVDAACERLIAATTAVGDGNTATLRSLYLKAIGALDPDRDEASIRADADILLSIVGGTSTLSDADQRSELDRLLSNVTDEVEVIKSALVFRPYDLAGCRLWLEPSGISASAWSGKVTGPAVGAPPSGSWPEVVESGPFGRRSFSFAGSGEGYLPVSGLSYSSSSHSLFCILRDRAFDTTSGALLFDAATGAGVRFSLACSTPGVTTPAVGLFTGSAWTALGEAAFGDQILGFVLDGATDAKSILAYRNGRLLTAEKSYASPFDMSAATAVSIAGRASDSGATFDGLISVVGMFDGALSLAETKAVHDYLFTLAGRPPAERATLVESALQDFLRLREARAETAQLLATEANVTFDTAAALLGLPSSLDPGAPLGDDLLPPTHADEAVPGGSGRRRAGIARFRKAAEIVRTLGLDTEMLTWVQGDNRDPAWLDLGDLPVDPPNVDTFDADTATIRGGACELPPWLSCICATSGRTAQVGSAKVLTGLAANTGRAFSRDGSRFGLLLEPATANVVDEDDVLRWGTSTPPPAYHLVTSPASHPALCEIEDLSTSQNQMVGLYRTVDAGAVAYSAWSWLVPPPQTNSALTGVVIDGGAPVVVIQVQQPDADWTYRSGTGTLASMATVIVMWFARDLVADVGASRLWGIQLERRAYPTSFVGAEASFSRAPDRLEIDLSKTTALYEGYFKLSLRFAPLYASTETAGDHVIFFHDAQNQLLYRKATSQFVLVIGGQELTSAAVTFGREQELTLTAAHTPTGRQLTITGATTGDGAAIGSALPIIASLPSTAYLFGGSGGCDEGVVLYEARLESGRPGSLAAAQARFAGLLRLADLVEVARRVRAKGGALLDFLATTTSTDFSRESYLDALALALDWPRESLGALATRFALETAAELRSDAGLLRLARAMDALGRLSVPASTALEWADTTGSFQSQLAIGEAVVGVAKQKYDIGAWRAIARPLRDVLREKQRDALVAYVLHDESLGNTIDLYDLLLVDPEMRACAENSRVGLAISSVQLFVHRILLGLEGPDVRLDKDARDEWQWRKYYRVWEANRKVFLFPEDYLEPELRDDKTHLFTALESELRQGDVDDIAAEHAYRNYLGGLGDIAHLRVAGLVHDKREPTETAGAVDQLHVFATSFGGIPQTLWHRRCVDREYWTAWERVPLDAAAVRYLPVVRNGRLVLYMLNYTDTSTDQDSRARYSLLASEHDGRAWGPVQTAAGFADELFLAPGVGVLQHTELVEEWDAGRPDHSRTLLIRERRGVASTTIDRCDGSMDFFSTWYTADLPGLTAERPAGSEIDGGDYGTRVPLVVMPLWSAPVTLFDEAPKVYVQIERRRQVDGDNNDVYRPVDELFMRVRRIDGSTPRKRTFFGYWDRGPTAQSGLERLPSNAVNSRPDEGWTDPSRVSARLQPTLRRKSTTSAPEVASLFLADTVYAVAHYPKEVMRFAPFYHPYVCDARAVLERFGVQGLLNYRQLTPPLQEQEEEFFTLLGPTARVATPYPKDEFEFRYGGAYSVYNWELFFHLPIAIAHTLDGLGRHEAAHQYYHGVFDPVGWDGADPFDVWRVKPLREIQSAADLQSDMDLDPPNTAFGKWLKQLLGGGSGGDIDGVFEQQLQASIADPFNPHRIARLRPVAYMKATVRMYIEHLVAWGDSLFRRDSIESIVEAQQLYLLASKILGPRPLRTSGTTEATGQTYAELMVNVDDASDPLVHLESVAPELDLSQSGPIQAALTDFALSYFCLPESDSAFRLWDVVEDRLFKIRHCMNIEGIERQLPLFQPPIDPMLLVRAKAAGLDIASVMNDLYAPPPLHRFPVLYGRALDFAGFVAGLGGQLLAALEKKDGEHIANMRATHEVALLEIVRETRKQQVKEAETSLEAVRRSVAVVVQRRDHYKGLIAGGLLDRESSALVHSAKATQKDNLAQSVEFIAQTLHSIPAITTGATPLPVVLTAFSGTMFARMFEAVALCFRLDAAGLRDQAAREATLAGYDRRAEEWQLQLDLAERELKQLEKQVVASEIRVAIAEHELVSHEKQLEQSREVRDFLGSKFTNEQLYSWMVSELTQTYRGAYALAFDMGRRAERAYRFERAEPDASFIKFGYWNGNRQGLLAAEKLLLDLRRMDAQYLEKDRREYELTKQVSLAEYAPQALVELREAGTTTVELSEALFDFDYPGHYLRRIKNASITLPSVTGSYSGVQATLTLLSSKIRASSLVSSGYAEEPVGEDPRFRYSVGATAGICTSHGVNDHGHFELNFREEKYLPFEGAGAASRFRIELPQAQNRFDVRSLADVVLTVQYTAREGGGVLKSAARRWLDETFVPRAQRFIAVGTELADAWTAFEESAEVGGGGASIQTLTVDLNGRIPFIPGTGSTRLRRLLLAAHIDSPDAVSFAVDFGVTPAGDAVSPPPKIRSTAVALAAVNYSTPVALNDTTILTVTITVPDNDFTESYPDPEAGTAPFRLKPEVFRDLFLILELDRDPLGQ